jgi:hypothetical protein
MKKRTPSFLIMCLFIFLIHFFIIPTSFATPAEDASIYIIAENEYGGSLISIDPDDHTSESVGSIDAPILSSAVDPKTGNVYVIIDQGGAWLQNLDLGVLDMETREFTIINELDGELSAIAFDDTGELYGITGFMSFESAGFCIIDKSTGQVEQLATYSREEDGGGLAFNEEDGKFYFLNGGTMLVIDPEDPSVPDEILIPEAERVFVTALMHDVGSEFYFLSGGTLLKLNISTGTIEFINKYYWSGSLFYWPIITGVTVQEQMPRSGSLFVGVDENLALTFDRDVVSGNGSLFVKRYDDDSIVETIDVTSDRVTGWNGPVITIDLNTNLLYGTKYYVILDQGAIRDSEENDFFGFSDKDDWFFTIQPSGNDFDFDDTFFSFDFIDDEQTDAHWWEDEGYFTLTGASGTWTHADRETEGKENIQNDWATFGENPKIALNNDNEPMVVWEQNGKIMFTRWDHDNELWQWMSGEEGGAEDISSVMAMGCGGSEGSMGTCGDGICSLYEAHEDFCSADCIDNGESGYSSSGESFCGDGVCSVEDESGEGCMEDCGSGDGDGGAECRRAERPQIYADADGNPIVAWIGLEDYGEGVYADVYVRKWDDDTQEWRTLDGADADADKLFDDRLGYEPWMGYESNFHMIPNNDGDPMIASTVMEETYQLVYTEWDDDSGEWTGKQLAFFGETYDLMDFQDNAADVRLACDNDNSPIMIWSEQRGNLGIRLTHWDGEQYTAYDSESDPYDHITGHYSDAPGDIDVDADGRPYVAYAYGHEMGAFVSIKKWTGEEWLEEEIANQYVDYYGGVRVVVDANDDVHVAWVNSRYDMRYARWDDGVWLKADDTPGYDNVETDGDQIRYFDIEVTSDGRPMIAWGTTVGFSAHFKQWNGSAWVAGDGLSVTSDNLSGDIYTGNIDMVINSDDEPSVVWAEDWGDADVHFSVLPVEIASPKIVQSTKINGSITGIVTASLTATENLNGDSYIAYFISGDGGNNWLPIENGGRVAFDSAHDLRWRAILHKGSVPELMEVHIDFETQNNILPDPEDEEEEEIEEEEKIEEGEENEGKKECSFDSVRDVTKDSVTLRVSVDDSYADEKVKFKVEVEDLYTGEKETIKISDKPSDNGKATLFIDALAEDTKYRFKVSYDEEEHDGYLYCPHSKTITTDKKIIGAQREEKYPECGNAAKTYTEDHIGFTGTFCLIGTEDETPTFPQSGESVSWICSVDGNTEQCHAKREKDIIPPPSVQGGAEPEIIPETIPVTEEQLEISKEPLQAIAVLGLLTGTMIAFATSAVPLFTTLPLATKDIFIMPFIGILARRKNEQNWGTVFESTTKQPIPGVRLMLMDQNGKEIETTYSDVHGRFGFLTANGTYAIQAEKEKFIPNFAHDADPLYGEVYAGNMITIDENKVIATNIALSAQGVDWAEYAQEKSKAYKGFFSMLKKWSFIIIFYAGFIFTGVVTYLYPSWINFMLLVLYVALFVYDNFIKRKKYGTVGSIEKKPIPFAIVSLHDRETNEKKSFAVTDVIGRYYLLSENGSYDMRVKGQPIGGHDFEKRGEIHVRDGIVRKDIRI